MATMKQREPNRLDVDTDLIRRLQMKGARVPVSHTKLRRSFEGKVDEAEALKQQACSPSRPPRTRPGLFDLLLAVVTLGLYHRA